MCVFVCTFFLFSWKVLQGVMFRIKNVLFFIVVLNEVQNGDKWPSLTHVTIGVSETWGDFFRLISKLWNVQRSSCSQHIQMMMKLWPWLLSFLPFFKAWASRSDFSRRNVWQSIQGWKISSYMSGDDLQFHHLEQIIIRSSIRPNATISITNIL